MLKVINHIAQFFLMMKQIDNQVNTISCCWNNI